MLSYAGSIFTGCLSDQALWGALGTLVMRGAAELGRVRPRPTVLLTISQALKTDLQQKTTEHFSCQKWAAPSWLQLLVTGSVQSTNTMC